METAPILSVEDEEIARVELEEVLRGKGYKVVSEPSAERAVIRIFNGHDKFGIILMDIKMGRGRIDGIDAAREIQERDRQFPIVFVSAFTEEFPMFKERAGEAKLRVAGWIEKPLIHKNMKKLLNVVDREFDKLGVRTQIQDEVLEVIESPSRMLELLRKLAKSYKKIDLLIDVIKDIGWILGDKLDALSIGDMVAYLNYIAYERREKKLKKDHAGEFVAFLDGGLVDNDVDRSALIEKVYQKTNRTDILIMKVSKEPLLVKLRRPRRVLG